MPEKVIRQEPRVTTTLTAQRLEKSFAQIPVQSFIEIQDLERQNLIAMFRFYGLRFV
jgi:hypothetical protein